MKTKTVKKASEIQLRGVKAELVIRDDSIKALIIYDEAGDSVRAELTGWNDFIVTIPCGKEYKDAYKLSGKIKGVKFEEFFDKEHEAITRQTEIMSGCSEFVSSEITKTQIAVDDPSI